MNNFFEQLKRDAHTIRMSVNEKQAMRVFVYDMLRYNPVGEEAEAYERVATSEVKGVKSPYVYVSIFHVRTLAPLLVVLVVLVGSGTAYASQGALPGDPLYTIKVKLTEPALGALALSPASKAQWNADVAQRRLEEAEALASQGKLTASTSEDLATNFDTHANAALTLADNLQNSDPESAAGLSAEFDSNLQAHGAILASLGDDSSDDQTKIDSKTLAVRVRSYAHANAATSVVPTLAVPAVDVTAVVATSTESTSSVRGRVRSVSAINASSSATSSASTSVGAADTNATATATTAPSNSGKNKIKNNNANDSQTMVTLRMQQKAVEALSATRGTFAAIQHGLPSSTATTIASQLDSIQNSITQGSAALNNGDNDAASQMFTQAFKTSVQLRAYLNAGKKFNQQSNSQLLPTLLKNIIQYGNSNDNGGKNNGHSNGHNSD